MLIKKDDRIIRVLETKGDHKLIINCSQKSMPTWIAEEDLSGYLCTITGWKHARATVEVLVLSHLVIIDHEPCYMVDRILNICLELAAAPINNSVSIDEIKSSAWF